MIITKQSPHIIRREVPKSLAESSLTPLFQRLYAARGVTQASQLDYSLKQLERPDSLKGLDSAIARLVEAFHSQQRVLIVGDFDADGATSCALGVLALRAMGLQEIDFLVPNRFDFGYGLTPEIVELAREKQPDLLITVDNGIASIDGVQHANALGIDVIVTDHHLPGQALPDAIAIVNPNQPECHFPSKNLAGVGVIFYLLSALRSELREQGWFINQNIKEPLLADYLDLVALGTVADVVPLDFNNRILVQQGIKRIRAGKTRPGILALLDVAGRQHHTIKAQDFGFIIGPRLNAAGRLDDISIGIRCLLTDDEDEARTLAHELDALNRDRRAIESSMQKEALSSLQQLSLKDNELPWGLCLYDEHWHQGVVGILASRIKEKYHRPVIAFAKIDEHSIKGSARSIAGLHIRDALDMVATRYPAVLNKFGGHAMAAGLSLSLDQYDKFKHAFDEVVREQLSDNDLQEAWISDGELNADELTLDVANTIQSAGPWGQGFPEPLFDGEFLLLNQRIVGAKHLKITVAPVNHPQLLIDAIAFNIDIEFWPNDSAQRVSLVYQLDVNRFRGNENIQLLIKRIEVV